MCSRTVACSSHSFPSSIRDSFWDSRDAFWTRSFQRNTLGRASLYKCNRDSFWDASRDATRTALGKSWHAENELTKNDIFFAAGIKCKLRTRLKLVMTNSNKHSQKREIVHKHPITANLTRVNLSVAENHNLHIFYVFSVELLRRERVSQWRNDSTCTRCQVKSV